MSKDPFNEEYVERTTCEDEILRCLVGSRAYNTFVEDSDFDYKGIYISPKNEVIGINKEQKTRRYSADDDSYSIRHFVSLAAKCVPNVLELLFCEEDCVVLTTPEGRRLRDTRDIFLSKICVDPYVGYAQSQLAKAAKIPTNRGQGRQDIVAEYGYDTKFALHTVRLLQTAEELLRDGILNVKRPNRDFLLDIRFGKAFQCYDEFRRFSLDLIEKIRELEKTTNLREKPDIKGINNLIIDIQQNYWSKLTNDQRDDFIAMLDDNKKPNKALVQAFKDVAG